MIDPDATRQAFAGLIEKPALTDALLNRPPFKFILDIITNTISSTGYLKNQFPKSDLDPNALADKTAKTAFLDKIISAVDDGTLAGVKSAKIIAGKEPELTNKLLVAFAHNARNHMGEAPAPQEEKKSKEKDKSKERSSSKTKEKTEKVDEKKERSKSKDRESRHKDREKEKEKEKDRKSSKDPREKRSSSKTREKEKSKDKDEKKEKKSSKDKDKVKDKEKPKKEKHKRETEAGPSHSREERMDVNSNFLDKEQDEGFEESHQESPHQLPEKMSPGNDSGIVEMDMPLRPPVPQFERPATAAARPQTSMGRPGTAAARPAPPKLKKKVIATIEETQMPAESTVEIMADEVPKEKEDLFIEQAIEEEPSFAPEEQTTQIEAEEGGLVQKMMETKAGLEEGQLLDDLDEDDTEFQREMNKLKDLQKTLQDITRTTFPLAHILEFAQEDLEAMIRELEKWRAETRQNEAEIKEKESMSIGEAQKLSGNLSNLEEEIRNVKTNLSNCKARIVANEERIQLLMKDI